MACKNPKSPMLPVGRAETCDAPPKAFVRPAPLPLNATDEAKLEKWAQVSAQHGLSGEWAVAARLGEEVTEEQIEMIGHLFGR